MARIVHLGTKSGRVLGLADVEYIEFRLTRPPGWPATPAGPEVDMFALERRGSAQVRHALPDAKTFEAARELCRSLGFRRFDVAWDGTVVASRVAWGGGA
jgi:hypothetical protein